MIPFDADGRMLVMHRGPSVRSAPNVWSFPSGMHEFGESMERCGARELEEEYGLTALRTAQVGTYENVPGDGYHWVITVLVALVEDVRRAVNKEPDKHDDMACVHLGDLLNSTFYAKYRFHSSFDEWAKSNNDRLVNAMRSIR